MTPRCIRALMLAPALLAGAASMAQEISPAERALFMTPHFTDVRQSTELRYEFHKAGSIEPGYDDRVSVKLATRADKSCCAASTEFLTGPRRLPVTDLDQAEGNPVIQYFLEHDIREMKRLTGGSQNYFRKLIRLSLAQSAAVRPVSFHYRGRDVQGQEITVSPYLDDPNRSRYPKLVTKRYVFLLSPDVPGTVYGIRASVAGESAEAAPVLVEEMMIEGAAMAAARTPGTTRTPDPTRQTRPR